MLLSVRPENSDRGSGKRGVGVEEAGRRSSGLAAGGRRRWVIAALLLILLAIVAGGIGLRARLDGWARAALEREVATRLGGELRFESFRLRLTRLEIAFSDAELHLPGAAGEGVRVSVVAGRARIAASSMLGVTAGRIRLAELVLERPAVSWVREPGERARAPQAPSRPLDLRVGHLEVHDGRFLYADREIPWSFSAEEVALKASWNPLTRALVGNVALQVSILRRPFVSPLSMGVRTRFRVRRHDVEIEGLVAEGSGIRASLDGNARLAGPITIVGRGEAQVEMDRLRPLLDAELPSMGGHLSGTFSVESGPGPIRLRGDVQGTSLRLDRFTAERARAKARYSEGHLELVDLRANAFDGELSGGIDIAWGAADRVRAELVGRDLAAAAVFDWIQLPVPAASRLEVDVDFEGDPGRRSSWSATGAFVATQAPLGSDLVPLAGLGEFEVHEGVLRLQSNLEMAAARFASRIEADLETPGEGVIEFEGTTLNARDTQLAVLRIAEAFELEPPELGRRWLGGAGPFRGSIRTGADPRVDLSLDLSQGRYGRRRFDRAELELSLHEGQLRIPRFALARDAERATGSGVVRLEPLSVEELIVEARALDPGWLLSAAEVPIDLTGRLDATLQIREDESGRQGRGEISLVEGRLLGEPFERVSGQLRIRPDVLVLEGLSVEGPVASGRGELTWWTAEERWRLVLDEATVRLAELETFRSRSLPVDGEIDLQGAVDGTASKLEGAVDFRGRNWAYRGQGLGDPRGSASFDEEMLLARLSGGGDAGWKAEFRLGWQEGLPLDGKMIVDDTLFEFGGGDPAPVWARVSGEVELEASLGDASDYRLHAAVESAEIRSEVERLELAGPIELSLQSGRLSGSPIRLVGPATDVEITAAYDEAGDRLEAAANGRVDLGLLTALLPEARAWGDVRVEIEADGPLNAPSLRGRLDCRQGRLRWLGFPQSVDELSFQVRFDGREAVLSGLRGRFGNGEIRADGTARLAGLGLESYRVRLETANARVAYPEGFRGIYEGELTISGTEEGTTIGGDLEMLLGEYEKDFDLGWGAARAYAVPDDSSLPEDVFLDLTVSADGNVWVRNDLANIESSFEIHVGGTLRRPEITGRLWMLEGGELVYRDVDYRVTSGSLDFVELDRLNPYLTLRAETTVKSYTIFLRVEGTLDQFEYELRSDPTLSTPDIIALLATGNTFEETTGTSDTATFTGDMAASYFSGALTDPFERQLERLLGLETVQIDPLLTEGESDPTTRLTLGEEVADDLFVIFSTELGGTERQLYAVDWRATRRFRFGVQRDTAGGVGSSVHYTRRFWWNRPEVGWEAALPASAPDGPSESRSRTVASVRIEGADPEELPELHRRIPLDPGEEFSRSAMFRGVEAIKRYYARRDRIETRVDASATDASGRADVVYRIVAAPPVQIEFAGTTRKEERRLRKLLEKLWVESVFAEDLYDDAANRIREYFHGRGHYAVDVRTVIERGTEQSRVVFDVDRGRPVRVERVTIFGAEQISEERIRGQMLTRPPTLLSRPVLVPSVLAEDISAIRGLYRNEGFLDVKVADPRVLLAMAGDAAEVQVEIREGPRFTVSDVAYPSDLPFDVEQMARWAGLESGAVFSPAALLQAESRLRSEIDARGYPDARVRGRFEAEDACVHVRFEIAPGELKRVGEIRVSGTHLTQAKIIRRELELALGDDISREKLLRSQHRLYQLGIFRNVQFSYAPMDPSDPSVQRLEIHVDESAPLTSSVGLGYDTEADARISFSLAHDNVGGYDRELSIQGKVSGLEQRIQVVGREPRLFGHKLPALLSVGWEEEQREDFTEERVTTALRVDKRITPKWMVLLRYSLQSVDLSDVEITPEELEEEKLVEGRLGDVGIAFVRDTRDNPFMAANGTYVTMGTRVFAKGLASEFTFVKNNFQWSFVRTASSGKSVASSVRVGLAFPYGGDGTVPISEAYFAGGDSTLRGFERDEVGPGSGGESLLLLNEEFRFPIWRALKGVVFYDTGNVWEDTGDFDPTDLRHVLGTGLRLETPIGPLRLEYGRKLDREENESSGEVFLAIGSAF
jgi:outer membrane protein assembly complex protein YaeT